MCQYKEWNKEKHKLDNCLNESSSVCIKGKYYTLCIYHAKFVLDCFDRSEIEIYKTHKKEAQNKCKEIMKDYK